MESGPFKQAAKAGLRFRADLAKSGLNRLRGSEGRRGSLSATIARFCAALQGRRRSGPVMTPTSPSRHL